MPHSTLTVGNVEITILHDAEVALPFNRTFPDVPPEAWVPYQQRYPDAYTKTEAGDDSLRVHFECYLVRSQGRTLLVDTGLGSANSNPNVVAAIGGGVDGVLLSELESAGFQAGDIDTVFLTHLHPDHVGWNVTRNGPDGSNESPTFPNARYVAHEADWAAYETPRDSEIFGYDWWAQTVTPLRQLGVLDLISGETELTGELTVTPTPGHTPGSMSMIVNSGGEKAFIMGDVFHGPAQVTETDWVFHYDMDPGTAGETRRKMLDCAESEAAAIAICHHSGFGRVIRESGKRYWQAL
ncbi:MAG: MBL fold metallo-hydrolase [Chloroflexi bacterium]|nr:MBL fold metallo-hydrolase [Chloroflexota bacterium]